MLTCKFRPHCQSIAYIAINRWCTEIAAPIYRKPKSTDLNAWRFVEMDFRFRDVKLHLVFSLLLFIIVVFAEWMEMHVLRIENNTNFNVTFGKQWKQSNHINEIKLQIQLVLCQHPIDNDFIQPAYGIEYIHIIQRNSTTTTTITIPSNALSN